MKRLRDFTEGFLLAVMVLAVLFAILVLGGCATGISVSDEEAVACRNEGCAVFTENELGALVRRALSEGYRRGWGAATRESGKGL